MVAVAYAVLVALDYWDCVSRRNCYWSVDMGLYTKFTWIVNEKEPLAKNVAGDSTEVIIYLCLSIIGHI